MSAMQMFRKPASCTRAAASYLDIYRVIGLAERVTLVRSSKSLHTRRPFHSSLARSRGSSNSQASVEEGALLDQYKSSLSFLRPTTRLADLRELRNAEDTEVVLHGYVQKRRDLRKGLSFATLQSPDLRTSLQIVCRSAPDEPSVEVLQNLRKQRDGTPIALKGTLKNRKSVPEPTIAENNGQIMHYELDVQELQGLNTMPQDILFTSEAVYPPEQRHLQMRQDSKLREALRTRAVIARDCREFLDQHDFVEIETPLLFKSTPEGAREFVVPTRRQGLAYALPQSPQQFKQVLMGSGIPRYYQLARCFRDEDLRADRQPEFTQLDLEMAFAGGQEVMKIITRLVQKLWRNHLSVELPERFTIMPYAEAMAKYGVDKPDIRLGMELSRVDHLLPVDLVSKISPLPLPAVDVLILRPESPSTPQESRKFIASFLDSSDGAIFNDNPAGAPGIFIVDSAKPLSGLQPLGFEAAEVFEDQFDLQDGDLVVLQARPDEAFAGGSIPLGNLRIALHREAVVQGLLAAPIGFEPLWITDFPLFTPSSPASGGDPGQGGSAGFSATHHPFTSPRTAADVDLLFTAPERCVGDHYDLVMNGVELGGGSRRINSADMQRLVFERVLGMPAERVRDFDHLLAVLRAGCPPHAGIALGFDRLVTLLLGRTSVRDVIAFPKSGSGEDPLMRSPGPVDPVRLAEYHLKSI